MDKAYLCVKPLREQICDFLRKELEDKRLRPGEVINLRDLSGKMGVSITPLRDALLQLEGEGMVSIIPRKGISVRQMSLRDIEDYYEVIGVLEAQVIRKVAPKLGSNHLGRMRQLNDEIGSAVEEKQFDVCWRLNRAFHDVYLGVCANHQLSELLAKWRNRLYEFPLEHSPNADWELHCMGHHEKFIELLEEGKGEEAALYMQSVHWSFDVQEPFVRTYYFRHQA